MAADDQIECALALADAALADDQHAEPEDVHQNSVNHHAFGQRILEQRRQLGNGGRRCHCRFEHRQVGALGLDRQLGRRRETAGDEHAGKVQRQRQAQRREARRRVEAFEIPDFTRAENQDAPRLEVFVEPGEREAGLLDVRTGDRSPETAGARQQLERESQRLGPRGEKRADSDAAVHSDSVSTSVNCPFARRYSTLTREVSMSRKITTPSPSSARVASASDIAAGA